MDEHLLSKQEVCQTTGLLIAHPRPDDSPLVTCPSSRLAVECSYASLPSTNGSEIMNNEGRRVSHGEVSTTGGQ